MWVSAGGLASACQRQVWFVGILFARKTKPCCRFVRLARELWQRIISVYSHPEDSRRASVGKETCACEADVDRRPPHFRQGLLYALCHLRRCFTQELQRNVECLGLNPSRIRSQLAHLLPEFVNALANLLVDIDSHKDSHEKFCSFGTGKLYSGDQLAPQHVERLL